MTSGRRPPGSRSRRLSGRGRQWPSPISTVDLIEAKLAPPSIRPGTVAKTDVIGAAVHVVTAVRDRRRARRIRQDHPAGAVGRGGSASLRVGRPRPARQRRRPVHAVHRRRDQSRRAARTRGARRAVRPGRLELVDARTAPRERADGARAAARARARRPARRDEPRLPRRARRACSSTSRPARRSPIASREEPRLPLPRWRMQGRLHEIGMADLRLDEREADALLQGRGHRARPGRRRRSGRAHRGLAGRALPGRALDAGRGARLRPDSFTGDDRLVSEYFSDELLSRLPEAEARFLMHTSVLERMCGSLCDALLETTRSAETLASLERSNGFVVPLDRRGEWYRYHHLFGELLRSELERREPEAVAALNRRAMAWCIAERTLRGGDPLRTGRGRDGGRRRAVRPGRPAPLLRRAHGDPRGVARVVRRRGAGPLPGAGRLRRLVPRR